MPYCSFCAENGHNIRTCPDARIENGWRDILRRSKIHQGPLDEVALREYLATFPVRVVIGVAVQYAGSLAQHSILSQIDYICIYVHEQAALYEMFCTEQRNAFLHWMDPSIYLPDGSIIPDDDLPELEWGSLDDDPVFSPSIVPILLSPEEDEEVSQSIECPICYEEEIPFLDMNTTSCRHMFCHDCSMKHLHRTHSCPICRSTIKTLQVRQQEHYDKVNELPQNNISREEEEEEYTISYDNTELGEFITMRAPREHRR